MMLWEHLGIARKALRAHPFRSLLTVLSITIGAFSIVLMSSLAESGLTTLARGIEEIVRQMQAKAPAATVVLTGIFPRYDRPALAANPAELNFGLFGPSYDGRVKECGAALGTITSQFQEKESNFWNSPLQIVAYGNIHEIAFRPWQSDNIPRRYCSGNVQLSNGTFHAIQYSIIEDGGFAGFGQGVEWCVVGLDRNWAYNPACKAARP